MMRMFRVRQHPWSVGNYDRPEYFRFSNFHWRRHFRRQTLSEVNHDWPFGNVPGAVAGAHGNLHTVLTDLFAAAMVCRDVMHVQVTLLYDAANLEAASYAHLGVSWRILDSLNRFDDVRFDYIVHYISFWLTF